MARERTAEDLEAKLELAKLSRKDLAPLSQSLFFHPEDNSDLILIEMDSHLMEELGKNLTIRGEAEDDLVVCTESRTYSVREAEISNSLLVVPHLEILSKENPGSEGLESKRVIRTFHHYWEPKQMKPSARKLHRILERRMYRGEVLDEHDESESSKTSFEDLLDVVQSSRGELEAMLASIGAIPHRGKYRLLDFEYKCRVLEFILTSIESNSMDLGNLNVETIVSEVSDLEPRSIVESILNMYLKPGGACLDKDKVCRTQAEALLRNGESFKLTDFVETWRQSLPEGFDPDLSCLYGISYTSDDSNPARATIHYLSFWDLPEQESARLQALLRLKNAWKLDEIKPYIEDLTLQNVNSLLLKYARAFKVAGQTFYSKK
ncbi:sister chromatid cohesion protein DCC1 [Galendromus occidentalis]|uniref:Sister chromatid cohesion protein DCC1 n=1 Tax=Galendromus occidentalis TaxID=34638 RepID=A0AAJ6VV57_9ACAR|nr:sister chromatid cohesion protein DCC1 [Galendromus occidentalis]